MALPPHGSGGAADGASPQPAWGRLAVGLFRNRLANLVGRQFHAAEAPGRARDLQPVYPYLPVGW